MPSPLTHSTAEKLVREFLKSLDQFNADDLTLPGVSTPNLDTSGARALNAINLSLQEMYVLAKDSRYLEAYPTTRLSSQSGVDFISLDEEAFLDEIESITETTNNQKLVKRSWNWYRATYPDPSEASGNPTDYIRRDNRVYLSPRPSSVINYTIDFRKLAKKLEKNSDISLFPSNYDFWTIAEARVRWHMMEDINSVPALAISERNIARENALNSIYSGYDESSQMGSAVKGSVPKRGAWDRIA